MAADRILLTRLSRIGGTESRGQPSPEDLRLWNSKIASLPEAGTADGSALTDGAPEDLEVFSISHESPMFRDGWMSSKSKEVFHGGVVLPGGMALQRVCVIPYGQGTPWPDVDWKLRILPMGLALNTLYGAGLIWVLMIGFVWLYDQYRKIRQGLRLAYGLCAACSHPLLPEQDRCPECGRERGGARSG